jgi:hypothetical protein
MPTNPVKVIRVKSQPPDPHNPHVTRGIASEGAAQRWAALMGADTVYYIESKQKAYCWSVESAS